MEARPDTVDSGIRVLVVAGEVRQGAQVRKALRAASPGFVVSPARRLWSATQILAGLPIDAVVLGMALPESDGLSALAKLRRQAPDIPLLVVGNDDVDAHQAGQAGADDYLDADHLDPLTLGRRLVAAIEGRRGSAGPAGPDRRPPPALDELDILVVEEDRWIQRLLRRKLASAGHQVHLVAHPSDALAWPDTDTHGCLDVLVCAVNPPGMKGRRLSEHLRKYFPELQTLLVAPAAAAPDWLTDADRAFGFLSTPYELDDFADTVDHLARRDDCEDSVESSEPIESM